MALFPLTMTPIADLHQNIFDSRDLEGNESSPPSDSDYESSEDNSNYDTDSTPDATDDDKEPESASTAQRTPSESHHPTVKYSAFHPRSRHKGLRTWCLSDAFEILRASNTSLAMRKCLDDGFPQAP